MSKVMVTGALGNVGGYVAKFLIKNNQNVVVADINHEALINKYEDTAECRYFDFMKAETYKGALEDVDRVFIMRPPHIGNPKEVKPFIEALKAKGDIKLATFLSLIGIENNPVPPHYKIEKYIEQAGLPYCHIRPCFFMQNISGVHAHEIKYFNKIVVPVKNALTSIIDAKDIGEITAKVLSDPESHIGKSYSITGGQALDYNAVANILSEELGRKIVYANPSPVFAKKYWIGVRGIDKKYATVMGLLYMMTRLGTAKAVTDTFKVIMGKETQTFREFVMKNMHVW